MTGTGAIPESRRPRLSRQVRALAYLFFVALLAYLAGVVILSTAWFHRVLLEHTRAGLARLTGTRVEIGEMKIDPWVFQATFHGLVLHGTETDDEPPLFVSHEAIVSFSPSAALRRQLRLRRLELEGASIHIYTRADGSTNLPGPAANFEPSAILNEIVDLKISHLLIGESTFNWDNRQFALDLTANNFALLLGFRKETYSWTLSSSALRLSNPDLRLPSLTISTRIEVARNRIGLTSIIWRSPLFSGNGALSVAWRRAPEGRFSFRTEGDAGALARLLHRPEVREGRFSADAGGTYSNSGIEAHGHFDARRLLILGPELRPLPLDLGADYAVRGQRVAIPRFSANLLGGSVRGKGEFSLNQHHPNINADLALQSLDLAAVLRFIPQSSTALADFPVASTVGGTLQVSAGGRSGGIHSRFDLALQAVPSGREPVSGVARGSLELDRNRSLDLDEVNLDSAHSHLSLHGSLSSGSANLSFSVQTTAFEEWRAAAESWVQATLPVKLDSAATFSGTASGTLAAPAIRGHLEAGAFEYQRWKWDRFQADVALDSRQLQVSSGRLLGANSALTVDLVAGLADWTFLPTSSLRLSARADRTSIRGLREVLGIANPLDGLVTGVVHLENKEGHLTAQSSFRVTGGSYDGDTFDSLEATLSRTGGRWNLARARLVKGAGQATADASYNPVDRTLRAHAQGTGFSLADFKRLQNVRFAGQKAGPASRIDGLLSFEGDGSGSVDDPSVSGRINVKALSAGGSPLGDLSSGVDWSARRGEVQGQLDGPGGGLKFHGTGGAEPDWPFAMTADYASLRLDSWFRALGLASPAGNIDATGSADLSGSLRDLAHLKLSTQVQEINVRVAELRWKNDKPFQIGLAQGRLNISPFELLGPATHFEVQGSADLGSPSALNLTAEGEIDSAFLHIFNPALLTAGHFDVQAQVRGTLTRPTIYGALHIHEVSLGYPRLPLHVAGLNGDVDLQGDRVVIRSLRADSGPASITITGGAVLSGTPRYNLRADLSRFRVDYPVQFTSVLNGSLHLSGTPGAGVLSGELTVAQMFVGENFNLLNWASALENQPALVSGPSPGFSSGVRLDVHVASAPVVSVESHDLTAVAAVDLALRGTVLDPVAFGSVHIQNGQAVLRQTSYKLSRGDIIMANPLRTEPVLDLEARTRIERYDLILRITGPAGHPNISYRSDPPLPTPNILALLAFGYTSQDQLIAQTGRSNLSAEGANALLTQALSTQVSSRITRLFGLSRIGVDPNPSSLGGARVTVEEQLRHDFTITYVNTTGGIQERIIQVEWDVTDNISLLGVRDQNGVYGLELDFRHRFK